MQCLPAQGFTHEFRGPVVCIESSSIEVSEPGYTDATLVITNHFHFGICSNSLLQHVVVEIS